MMDDNNLIHPSPNTQAQAAATGVVSDIGVRPYTPVQAAPSPSIGFHADPQPAVAAPANPMFQSIPRPVALPVVTQQVPLATPVAEELQTSVAQPAVPKVRRVWKAGTTMRIAAVFTAFMVMTVAAAYLFNQGQQPVNTQSVNRGAVIPEQDLDALLPVESANSMTLQGGEDVLILNGDLVTTGALKLYSGEYYTNFVQGTVTADQSYELPDASGTICLDSNNCGFATTDALSGIQSGLEVVSAQVGGTSVATFNGQTGAVSITGGNGITIVDLGDGQFQVNSGGASGNVSLGPVTPQQDSSNNASINLTKTGSGNLLQLSTGVPASPVQRFVVDQNGVITVGSIDYSRITNHPSLVNTIGGTQGAITLGTGLQMSGQSLLNSGVTSLNGQTGGVSLFAGTGIGITGTTITNLGVTEILGTPNQVNVIPTSGVVTLSLPQDISVSSTPVFAGLTVNGPLSGDSLAINGTVRITTGGVLQNVTNANAGTFFTGGTLAVNRGGTGAASFVANGILFGNGSGAIQSTLAGSNGQCLVATTGAAPSWISCLTAAEGAAPGGGAGGDLTGSYPNPTIAKLQGNDLTITGGTLDTNQFLMFDGTAWVNQGLHGDIFITADGLVTLSGNSVVSTTIADNAVTNGKLAFDSVTINAGTGLTGGGAVALGSNTTVSVLYGATSGTALEGDATLTVTAGTNLTGGGTVALGDNGSVTVNTVSNPNFTTSVTTPILQGATSLTLSTLATADANDIIISAAGAEIGRFLENGDYRFEKGSFDLTLSTASISGSSKTITLPNETGTICTTGSVCTGYAAAAGSNNYVQLQGDTPGTPQNGNFNLSGTGIIGIIDATTVMTDGVTRLTSAGVLQDVTNGNAGTFFTGGTLGVSRGGTGLGTFTQYGVLFGNGTGALGVTVAGIANQCLVGNNGAAPSWIDCDVAAEGAEPGGTAGGDLSGTYPNPTLAKLQGTDLLINSPIAGQTLVYNATNSRWDNIAISGDLSINETGVATITANSVALGADTTGNYVSALGTLIGLSTTGNTGEGSTPTLSVIYGSGANTAAQGNTSITINAGSNIDGGGSITLGAGGSLDLDLSNDLSVNSLALATALGVGSGGTGATTFTANGILFGNGSSALGVTAAGTTGQCLVGQTGSVPTWADCDAAAGGSTPGGNAGGDLSGTYPNPTIAKLQGTTISVGSLSAGQFLVYNTTNGAWQNATMTGDVSLSEIGITTITSNAVALGADTTGNYIASLGTLTGLSVTGNTGEGSTPALSVTYGSSANTAVQGNTTLTVTAGTNLTGGGAVTLGAGGTITLETSPDPTFNSVTLTNALGVASGGIGTNSLTSGGILLGNGTGAITTSGVLTNGQLLIGDGTGAPTVATLTGGNGITITNGAGSISVAVNNTVCTTSGVCNGYAPASGSTNYVNIQGATPGTPQTGNFNIDGIAIVGSLDAGSVLTNGTTRLTSAGVLQNVTNANAGTFFTGGTLSVSRGGTGLASITSNGLVYGNGTGAVGITAAGASGQCLVGNTGSAPTWADCTEVSGGGTPSGPAGGDLSGTYPNPTIAKLQGTNLLINTPTGGHMLIYNATNTRWENVAISSDVSISETGVATIAANSVALGTDTTGSYVANLGTLTGLSATGNSGEGSTPALSVLYGSTSNTAVQGNITVVCPSGSGNINGGGNTLTLGTGGSCSAISITNAPVFTTSVTSPIFQGSGSMTLNTLATAGADDIIFSTGGAQVATILENGNFGIGAGLTAPTAKLQVDGTTLVKTSSNTVSAFEVQNSSSAVLLTADTTNQTVSIGVASGQKQINILGSVTLNTVQTVTTSDAAIAVNGYTNQKKITTLSDGSLVTVAKRYGSQEFAEFNRSANGGGTWSTVNNAIDGWSNGSISSYIDAGGTERLVAVWKQSGAGGGRTNNHIYVAVGAFNAGRTILTFGTPILLYSDTASGNYPDIVATNDGSTGGAAYAVWSDVTASNNYMMGREIVISAAGVPTTPYVANAHLNVGPNTNHTFPNVAINPSTRDIYLAWSKGGTGAGSGIRFKMASWSPVVDTRVWGFGSEVDVDTAHYLQVSNFGSLKLVWDGTRVIIGGMVFDGGNYRVRVYDSTNLTTFTNRVTSDIGSSMYATSIGVDFYTGDVYLFGSGHNGTTYHELVYYKATRSGTSLSLGSRTVLQTVNSSTSYPHFVNTHSEAGRVSWFYAANGSAPFNLRYNSFSITAASSTYDTTSKLVVNGNIEASSITINGVALGAGGGSSQWLQNGSDIYFTSGKVGIGTNTPTAQLHVSGSTAAAYLLKVTDGTATAADVFTIADEGAALFKNRTNSTAAFDVQNAAGSTVFNVDSTNQRVTIGAASGQKAIGVTSESISAPATVGSSNTGAATIEGAQRKLTKLSTGRTVAIYDIGANYASLYYSDNGTSWTNLVPGNGIDGWFNGSISAYVDAGGTERLVAVWKQNGTGGGRVNGYYYAMVGTFNAGRTALTWGTALNLAGSTALQQGYDYPDVVAFADGTGGQAAFAISFNRGFQSSNQSYTAFQRVPIDASGNFGTASIDNLVDFSGSDNWGVMGGDYATTSWSYPSLDYNPLTKDIYMAWSAGGTGAGRGMRFKRAAYSAGTWTWGSEVEVDNTRYNVNDSTMAVVRYDASGPRVVIGAELYDGSNADVMLYDLTTTGTLTTTRELAANVVSTASRIAYGSMAVDPSTGNAYFAGSNNSAAPFNLNYRKWTRATNSSTIGVLDTIETAGGAGYASLVQLNNSIGILYTKGPSIPVSVKFISISLPTSSFDTTSKLVVNGNIEASSITINGVALGGGSNAWLQNASDIYFNTGKVSIGAGSVPTAQLHVKGSAAGVALLRVTDGTSVEQDVFSIADEGAATFRNRTDSTTAFDVQNAAGSTMLNIDTTNQRVSIGVSSGQKTITVYTGEAVATPRTIISLTSDSSMMTTYNNQRKLVRLSDGTLVSMFHRSTPTWQAYFQYSKDGGSTWTDYGANVLGAINGSISSYIDTGGTERIVFAWKQSGTAGSRVSEYQYIMVGAFNAARTTLTWGTPTAYVPYTNAGWQPHDYPDVVAHAEGTGGVVHIVYSASHPSGTNVYADYDRFSINSSGVLGSSGTGGGYVMGSYAGPGSVTHTFPSIDYDPSTKRLFATWMAGSTGAGKGVRYRTAAYSAGSWTWGTEREIDPNLAITETSNQYSLRVRWDGTVAVIGGNFGGGLLRVWERDAADTTTTTLLSATQSDFYGSSLEINDTTRDIYLIGSRWNGSAYDRTAYRKYTRSTSTWGSLTLMDTITSPVIGVVSTTGGSGYMGWVYSSGTSLTYTIKYGSIDFGAATSGYDTTSKLVVNGNIEASSFTINGVALSTTLGASPWSQVGNNIFYNLGSISVGTSSATARLHVSSGEVGTALLKVTDVSGSGADVLSIADGGAATFKPQTNSTNTFDVQNAGGSTIFNVDSTNQRVQIGVASGQKSITVFTGEALNAPVVIQSNSFVASTATAYSNQKKFTTLSTGRQITTNTITSGGTPTAMFFYTDDGITWGGYSGTDITGWSNGSIFSYVDAGGIERLVAVWKQSGTGGGRTTDYVYAMVGTFNAGRTSMTWGTALMVQGGSVPTRFNYPDLVAHSEGAGGKAHIMMGYQDTSPANLVNYYPVTVDASGVPTLGTVITPGAISNVNINPFASIDMNPSTKDLYVAWTNGATGAGKGLRYQRATYASGVWTWNTEVEVDNGYFVQNAADQGMVVRFDGTRVIIGGALKTASNNQLAFWESSNFTSFGSAKFSEVIANSTYLYGFGMAVNPTNGDIYFSGSQYNGSAYADAAYRKWTRATSTMGSRVIADAFTTNAVSPPYVHAYYGNNRINFTYTTGASSPYTVKYAAITFTTPTTGVDTTSKLVVNGNIEASSITINGISLGSALGSQWIQSGNNIFYAQGSVGVGTGSTTARLHVSTAETGLALLKITDATGSGQDVLTIADGGAVTFRNQTNSTAAVDVQNVAGVSVFNVDTTNQRVSVGVVSGQKVIQIPGSSLSGASSVGTSTTASAGIATSQKKMVNLSTGRRVAVFGDTSTNAKFKYSDDGTSWTDYSADIAGWANGSITSYVDTGGTERLVAAWKQTGTGGGRVDTYNYVMTGAFNSARTTITWSAANAVYTNGAGNYSDVAATADGTGGLAMIVMSYNDGSSTYALSFTITINSSGTPSVGSQVNLDGPYSTTTAHAYPSIDINPSTKDVYVAWTSHVAGASRGIRFKRGVYATSAWTWGSNIAVSENQFTDNAVGRWMNLRWDAGRSRVIVGGIVRDAGNSITKIWSSTDFTNFSTLVSEDPINAANRLMYGSLAVAPLTGDIYLTGSLDSGTWAMSYRKYTQSTATLGALVALDTPGVSTLPWVYTLATTDRVEWLYTTGTGSPYTVKYIRLLSYATGVDTTSKLVVNGNLEASSITINGQAIASAGNIFWLQSGSTVYYAGGNVGIGTSTAAAKLHVVGAGTDLAYFDGTSAAPELVLRRVQNLAVSAIVGRQIFQGQDAGGTMRNFWDMRVTVTDATAGAQKGDLTFHSYTGATGTERLRVTQAGSVGIGTATPNGLLQLSGTGCDVSSAGAFCSSPHLRVTATGANNDAVLRFDTASNSRVLYLDDADGNKLKLTGGGATTLFTFGNTGVLQLNTYGAGTLSTDASGNVTSSSDERLKDVQGNFNRGLSDLLNIDPIMYKWNGLSGMETEGSYAGFSAQNIQIAIPEAVSTDSRGYLTLQDRPLLAASVNAIKELNTTDHALEARVLALETAIGSNPTFASLNVTGHTTLSSLTVSGNVNIQGTLTVANAQVTGSITIGGRILSTGNKPQISKGADLGLDNQVLAASVEIDGTDTAGTLSFVAGIMPSAGTLAKVTFTQAYEKTPRIVVTATNEDGLTLPVFVRKLGDGFEIVSNQEPVAGKTYQFDYVIIGAQAAN